MQSLVTLNKINTSAWIYANHYKLLSADSTES